MKIILASVAILAVLTHASPVPGGFGYVSKPVGTLEDGAVGEFGNAIGESVSTVAKGATDLVDAVATGSANILSDVGKVVGDGVSAFLGGNGQKGLVGDVLEGIGNEVKGVEQGATDIVDGVSKGASDIFNTKKDAPTSVVDGNKGAYDNISSDDCAEDAETSLIRSADSLKKSSSFEESSSFLKSIS